MTEIHQLTPNDRGRYLDWLAAAMRDDSVWPYLTAAPFTQFDVDLSGDWAAAFFMDDQGRGLARLLFDRNRGTHAVMAGVWALGPDPADPARARTAGSLLNHLIERGCRRYGVRWLDVKIHGSNTFCQALFAKRASTPWGVEPEGAWDGKLGRWVDLIHYRFAVVGGTPQQHGGKHADLPHGKATPLPA